MIDGKAPKAAAKVKWHQVIALSPLACILLIVIVGLLTPGPAFFDGRMPGIYWLFLHGDEIELCLVAGMVVVAALAVVIFILRLILRKATQVWDVLLVLLNIIIVGAFIIRNLMAVEYWAGYGHFDTQIVSGHTYHLAGIYCRSSTSYCGTENLFKVKYAVIDCGSLGIVCNRVYVSEPIGWEITEEPPHGPQPGAKFAQDKSGRLQLVDGATVLWQSP